MKVRASISIVIDGKVGRGNSGHGVIRATSTLQQERSIHWILASSEL